MRKVRKLEISDEEPERKINSALIGRLRFDHRICQKSREDQLARFLILSKTEKRRKTEKMEIKVENCDKKHFLETSTRNRVSKMAGLFGSQNIVLSGKVFVGPTCVIRGDLAHVRVGKYSMVRKKVINTKIIQF